MWQSAWISWENCRCHSWHRMGPGPFSRSCHSESVSSVLLRRAPVRCSLCMLHCLLACSIGLAAKGDIWWLMCSHVPPLLWAADALHRQIGREDGGAWGGQAVERVWVINAGFCSAFLQLICWWLVKKERKQTISTLNTGRSKTGSDILDDKLFIAKAKTVIINRLLKISIWWKCLALTNLP